MNDLSKRNLTFDIEQDQISCNQYKPWVLIGTWQVYSLAYLYYYKERDECTCVIYN